jgi:nucleoside-diphosphate-sugar epimerase
MDLVTSQTDPTVEWMTADIRDEKAMRAATAGVDGVIHAAALHGVHSDQHGGDEFWTTNVDGTRRLYEACIANGVRYVVLCSSIGVYGLKSRAEHRAVGPVAEHARTRPHTVYELTKVICEQIADFHAVSSTVRSAILRLGVFTEANEVDKGVRLLSGGVSPDDAADAVHLAWIRLTATSGAMPALNVTAPVPFLHADRAALGINPHKVILERFRLDPPAARRLSDFPLNAITDTYDSSRAVRVLGWAPKVTFKTWLDATVSPSAPSEADPLAPGRTSKLLAR